MLADLDPNLTINSIRTMRQQIELSFDQERAVASLAGLFGIVALIPPRLVYAAFTAYSVAQRTNEIGIRMASVPTASKSFVSFCAEPSSASCSACFSACLWPSAPDACSPLNFMPSAPGIRSLLLSPAGALAICSFFAAIHPGKPRRLVSP